MTRCQPTKPRVRFDRISLGLPVPGKTAMRRCGSDANSLPDRSLALVIALFLRRDVVVMKPRPYLLPTHCARRPLKLRKQRLVGIHAGRAYLWTFSRVPTALCSWRPAQFAG